MRYRLRALLLVLSINKGDVDRIVCKVPRKEKEIVVNT